MKSGGPPAACVAGCALTVGKNQYAAAWLCAGRSARGARRPTRSGRVGQRRELRGAGAEFGLAQCRRRQRLRTACSSSRSSIIATPLIITRLTIVLRPSAHHGGLRRSWPKGHAAAPFQQHTPSHAPLPVPMPWEVGPLHAWSPIPAPAPVLQSMLPQQQNVVEAAPRITSMTPAQDAAPGSSSTPADESSKENKVAAPRQRDLRGGRCEAHRGEGGARGGEGGTRGGEIGSRGGAGSGAPRGEDAARAARRPPRAPPRRVRRRWPRRVKRRRGSAGRWRPSMRRRRRSRSATAC